jgi:hypothetical protein
MFPQTFDGPTDVGVVGVADEDDDEATFALAVAHVFKH